MIGVFGNEFGIDYSNMTTEYIYAASIFKRNKDNILSSGTIDTPDFIKNYIEKRRAFIKKTYRHKKNELVLQEHFSDWQE